MNQQKDWPNIILPFIFPFIFIIMLAFTGPFLIQVADEKEAYDYDKVMVTVDRAERYYKVGPSSDKDMKHYNYYVSYDYNGVHYSDIILGEHGRVETNHSYEMLIDPEDPTYVCMPSSWTRIWGIVLTVLAGILAVVVIPFFIKRYKRY